MAYTIIRFTKLKKLSIEAHTMPELSTLQSISLKPKLTGYVAQFSTRGCCLLTSQLSHSEDDPGETTRAALDSFDNTCDSEAQPQALSVIELVTGSVSAGYSLFICAQSRGCGGLPRCQESRTLSIGM